LIHPEKPGNDNSGGVGGTGGALLVVVFALDIFGHSHQLN